MIFNREYATFVSLLEMRKRMNMRDGAETARIVAKTLASADNLRNDQADDMTPSFPYWEAGTEYEAYQCLTDPANGCNYIVMQNVTSQEHQPPHGEGLLALYRPIPKRLSDGTYIFVYGQNVFAGDICRDENDVKWIALKDMLPCVWPPASGNEWAMSEGETGSGENETGGNTPGTIDDPIPAVLNMRYELGKYYSEDGKVYLCTRDTEIPVAYLPSQLLGVYFEVAV